MVNYTDDDVTRALANAAARREALLFLVRLGISSVEIVRFMNAFDVSFEDMQQDAAAIGAPGPLPSLDNDCQFPLQLAFMAKIETDGDMGKYLSSQDSLITCHAVLAVSLDRDAFVRVTRVAMRCLSRYTAFKPAAGDDERFFEDCLKEIVHLFDTAQQIVPNEGAFEQFIEDIVAEKIEKLTRPDDLASDYEEDDDDATEDDDTDTDPDATNVDESDEEEEKPVDPKKFLN